jgi:hypothetical protein
MAFETLASRKNAKLRLALEGVSGAGKTYSALLFAAAFGALKIGVLDSERGSSQLYAGEPGLPPFYPEDLQDKTIQEYIEKIGDAAAAGIDFLIIDSYSHSWISALETVDAMGGNKFSNGWKTVSPMVRKLNDVILSYPGHVLCTMRSKADYVVEKDEKTGKSIPKKVGLAAVTREGTEYEFTIVLDLTKDGTISVSKTRCGKLNSASVYRWEDVPKIARTIKDWLNEGAPQSPREAMLERIRFAQSRAQVDALRPEIAKLSVEDRTAIKSAYVAKLGELAEQAAVMS